jgi:hypothetical protein
LNRIANGEIYLRVLHSLGEHGTRVLIGIPVQSRNTVDIVYQTVVDVQVFGAQTLFDCIVAEKIHLGLTDL